MQLFEVLGSLAFAFWYNIIVKCFWNILEQLNWQNHEKTILDIVSVDFLFYALIEAVDLSPLLSMQQENEACFATQQYLLCIKVLFIFFSCSGQSWVQVADLFIQTHCEAAQTKWKLLQSYWVQSIKSRENRPPSFIPHFLKRNTFYIVTRFAFTLTEVQSLSLPFYRHVALSTAITRFEFGINLLLKPRIFFQDGQ